MVKKTLNIKQTRFLITGGSGTFGRNIIKILSAKGAKNIISISRDENLIKEAEVEVGFSPVKFKLGDITDTHLISRLMQEVDVVFHTAAIKHVSLAEQNPREAHRINVTGLLNLLDNSSLIKRFIHVSSDKAIGVINCYGATKLVGEYLVRESNELYHNQYLIIRCPNLLGSRGSVTDVWKRQLIQNNAIKITDPDMTRYFVTPQDAAEYVVEVALKKVVNPMEIYYPIKFTKKYLLKDLAQAFIELFGDAKTKIEVMGSLPGEKKHEDYISEVQLVSKLELKKILSQNVHL
ncbi:hypothetical protein A3C32_04275 [Candidatus Daviesbacteria bacterium RIFCSPHIGHO2_02_FULL_41_14]|uniref:Polysaccharide biosynthesis protein CapD-like domain-containing protein n=1 Tax=Candidatus Daviesbacteria bacterium RIFCSPLOWO2_01_FULL_40_24 TaxID=1797787 RepID=A0A1F5MJB3_9BACT|nr:MAG: hypothetical protein A3C32_04275 [Candidatus Daviesbacteria bacterium RIFCSPHIGHO2_02_FULL_41_14]OGE65443.1 MAG: hypothetical protein A3B49_00970 [Candidatus Daviesbacteria bacterium RIFCSPLOWO2_01_FULL_40_24]